MNYIKPSIKGLDIPIQKLQVHLYNSLKKVWPIDDSSFNGYGRVYRNQTDDGYTPERYVGADDLEYEEVYHNDGLKGSFFFGVGEIKNVNKSNYQADVFLIMMIDLTEIKPGNTRDDEEAHNDVEKICSSNIFGFLITGVVTGIDNVFKEYTGFRKTKGIQFTDMHANHCFRLNFKLTYNIYDC